MLGLGLSAGAGTKPFLPPPRPESLRWLLACAAAAAQAATDSEAVPAAPWSGHGITVPRSKPEGLLAGTVRSAPCVAAGGAGCVAGVT